MNNYKDIDNLNRLLKRIQKFLCVLNKKEQNNVIIAIPEIEYDRILVQFRGKDGQGFALYFWENNMGLLTIEVPVIQVDYFYFAEEIGLNNAEIKYIREL